MKIECKAEYYNYKVEGNKVYFYNELYNDKTVTLLLTAIVEALLPDVNSFNLPLSVEAEIENNTISLDKKLEVRGTNNYSYFIHSEHYDKWKKTYALIYWCMILVEVLIGSILLYIFIGPSNFNWIAGIIFALLTFMVIFSICKFKKQIKMAKKYQIRH